MATAYEIANYLVYLMNDVCDDLSNMKLNKILYYAQGHFLVKTGHTLFPDSIEAWDHGPIIYDVYSQYKANADAPIKSWDAALINHLSDEEQNFLIDIARTYSKYTASALRNMTHVPNGPWDKAYIPGVLHTEIPVSTIKDYFEKRVAPIKPVELNIDDDSFIGYRDHDDVLVLPRDWDDE